MKNLILLGGGHAHVHVLSALAEQALPGTKVTMVSPYPRQMYSGMVPGLVAGHYQVDDCVIPIGPLAEKAGVVFIRGAATGLDAAARRVLLADGRALDYDALSIDTGPVMDRGTIPGAAEHALFVRPIEEFALEWDEVVTRTQRQILSIVVVGGGAAGVELAMAIQFRLRERARVSLVTGGSAPLPGFRAGVRERALRALKRLNVTVLADTCSAVTSGHVQLGSGTRLECDAALLAVGASAPPWLRGSALALDEGGFVSIGPTLQSVSHPEVFAAGDVASWPQPVAKSGVHAVRAGPPLALNLRRFLAGGELQRHVPQKRTLYLLSCGSRDAIASWGPWAAQGRWVWLWKNRIDRGFIAKYR